MIRICKAVSMLAVIGLCGCTNLTSEELTAGTSEKVGEGIAYMLPMQLARVTVVRAYAADTKELKAAQAKAEKDVKDAQDKYDTAKNDVKAKKDLLDALPADSPARSKAQSDLDTATAQLKLLEDPLAKAKIGLADAMLKRSSAGPEGGELVDNLTIDLDPVIPDPRRRFSIDLRHSPLRDDHWEIKTTPEGLLSSSDVTSQDMTPQILVELARAAGAIAGQAISGHGFLKIEKAERGPFTYVLLFDPSDTSSAAPNPNANCVNGGIVAVADINGCFQKLGIDFQISLARAASSTDVTSDLRDCTGTYDKSDKCADGLVYRRPIPYAISVDACVPAEKAECVSGDPRSVVQTKIVSVPNKSPLEVIPYTSSAFVTRTQKVAFQNGMLVSVDSTKPSEVLGIVRTPVDMISAAGKAITDISPIKVDYINRKADAAEAEAKYYQAQKAAMDARKAYEDAQRAADEAAP